MILLRLWGGVLCLLGQWVVYAGKLSDGEIVCKIVYRFCVEVSIEVSEIVLVEVLGIVRVAVLGIELVGVLVKVSEIVWSRCWELSGLRCRSRCWELS